MAYFCHAWDDSPDFSRGMLQRNTKQYCHRMESFALVVFAVGRLLQLALVTTSPSLTIVISVDIAHHFLITSNTLV